jgi:ribosomal protein S18 acetylase RimI-like enzyme
MGGIGEVATHVEFRRQRHVANLLRLCLEQMRALGMTTCML